MFLPALSMLTSLSSLTVPAPAEGPLDWNEEGVVLLPNLLPDRLIDDYERCWLRHNSKRSGGWPDCTPYRRHRELMAIATHRTLAKELQNLLGEPAGVHLNLTGWVSTERDWHQDRYLNPSFVGDYYAAVWVALDNIHPDSGPFQYVPGSHRWPQVTNEKILAALRPEERDENWPWHSERLLTPLFERYIQERGVLPVSHLPKRGDVLIWHGRLLHRGSRARVQQMERRALIMHYSGINHRQDMPKAKRSSFGGWYFPI
jgi:ectoine hydroxylase-related dioxygenase (phytanoyl-CoA dioxygenase family)